MLLVAQPFWQQVADGTIDYIGSVRDDVKKVTGNPSMTLKAWVTKHKAELSV